MTGLHDTSTSRDTNAREFHREQLSAMMDGALSADEARFLLRRMEHDDQLADCWERWQFVGDAMRGHAGRALPADFSRRVGRAITTDLATADLVVDEAVEEQTFAVAAAPGARRPLLRWGGGAALAASVALAALIGSRTLSSREEVPPPAIAAAPVPIAAVVVAPAGSVPAPGRVLPDDGTAQAGAAAIVVAAAASKDSRTRRPHLLASAQAVPVGRSGAAAPKASASSYSPPAAVQLAQAPHRRDLAPHADMTSKPWPRALVPGASAGGEVTAGFEGSPAFQPFQPPRPEWRPSTAASSVEAAAPSP